MLENTNDYMSVLSIILIMMSFAAVFFHLLSQKAIARHLRQEADYYSGRRKSRR